MNHEDILDDFYNKVGKEAIPCYKSIADTAVSLGYKPKRDQTACLSISFVNRKVKKTILKFSEENGKHYWKFKFYSNKTYSSVFDKSIKGVIERFDFKYVGCYKCGKCEKDKRGYTVSYQDGRKYFRCGFELIPIYEISALIAGEAIAMMKKQHNAFLNDLTIGQ